MQHHENTTRLKVRVIIFSVAAWINPVLPPSFSLVQLRATEVQGTERFCFSTVCVIASTYSVYIETNMMIPQTPETHLSILTTQLLAIFSGCENSVVFSGSDRAWSEWDEIEEMVTLFSKSQTPYLIREVGSKCIFSNMKILTPQPIWPRATRFNFCKTHTYNSRFVDRVGDNVHHFHDLYNYMACIRENPNFVITLSNRANSSHSNENGYPGLRKIVHLPVSSVFLFVFDGELIRMLCLACLQHPLRTVIQLDKKSIVHQYESLHADLGGSKLHYTGTGFVAGDCSPNSFPRGHFAASCTVNVLARQLNVSLKYGDVYDVLIIFPRDVVSSIYANWFFDSFKAYMGSASFPARYDWLHFGQRVNKYSFVQVLSLENLNGGTLLNAFELLPWLIFACTILVLLAILCALTKSIVQGAYAVMISTLILIWSFALEKCEITPNLRASLTFRATCVLTLWALSTMVISGMYKGALYSTLSSPILPEPPRNVKNIMDSKTFFFSTATVYTISGSGSLFHYSISALRRASPDSSWTELLENFCQQLVYVRSDPFNLVRPNVDQHKPLEGTINHEPVNITLPQDYIFMEENFQLNAFRFMSKLTGALKSKVILRGNEISFLTQRLPVVVFGNFFSPIFSKLLGHYVESGIWDLWERWSDIWRVLNLTNSDQNGNFTKRTNTLALLFENFHSTALDKAEELSPKSLNLVKRVLVVYFVGILGSCLCLAVEKFKRIFRCRGSS